MMMYGTAAVLILLEAAHACAAPGTPRSFSGIHPSLAMYNDENECGTGAVVPWAGRLWVITYGPHLFKGSSDKLYEIAPDLGRIVRPESIGGTHANRMVHRESRQLFIGCHAIGEDGTVRTIPWRAMPGRLTGTARHLTDPARKLYAATMEEGLYEIDVGTLAVKELIRDGNIKDVEGLDLHAGTPWSALPGCHGKGLFSGQGRLVYANNGEQDPRAGTDPTIPSGALAEWRGEGDWRMVRRGQFTEVRGPGDIRGNPSPDTDPVWALGWDCRSVILMLLDGGAWHAYRLPKGSHSYDGAHGWNTEWPRIRDIGEPDMLATMHGTFWRFPRTFSLRRSAGIAPRSNYLKVVGDFCRWNDRLVLGCDDSPRSEFLSRRPGKSPHAAPGQSNSNLWFIDPARLDRLGPALGSGWAWLDEDVEAGAVSDPYLFAGYDRRMVHVMHASDREASFALEVDRAGDGKWRELRTIAVPAEGYAWHVFTAEEQGAWIRVRALSDAVRAGVCFQYSNRDPRPPENDAIFDGIAGPAAARAVGGLMWGRGENRRTLGLAAAAAEGGGVQALGFYELDGEMRLAKKDDPAGLARVAKTEPPRDGIEVDAASVIAVEDGRRYRLPRCEAYLRGSAFGAARACREVVTERDLFNCHGTFYELPARNAGGFAKIRPIATHGLAIHDYASFRGLLLLTGIDAAALRGTNDRIVASDDGRCAVWAGVIDDLWMLGKPRGRGGPWKDSPVEAGAPSDPYLMHGFDAKKLALSHDAGDAVVFTVEVDPGGTSRWCVYETIAVAPGATVSHEFPEGFAAHWVRLRAGRSCTATAQFTYE